MALELAQKINAVIVNSDSQQVYKELQILSARPTTQEMQNIPHYLYGSHSGAEIFSVGHWREEAKKIIQQVTDRPIIFCGGTGLYLHSLYKGMAEIPPIPEEIKSKVRAMNAEEVAAYFGADASDNHRRNIRALEVFLATGKHIKQWQQEQTLPEFTEQDFLTLFMNVPRETLYEKIDLRFLKMMEMGALEEVKALMELKLAPALPIMKAVGVPELAKYLDGEIGLQEAISKAQQNSRNYAKRQLTWARNQLPNKIEVQNMSFDSILNLVRENLQ